MATRFILVRAIALASLVAMLAAPAGAGTVYSWITEDGTHAFADSLKRVPARYRDEVKTRQVGRLASYERYTPSNLRVQGSHTSRLASNLERVRSVNAELDRVEPTRTASAAPSILLRTDNRGNGINLPLAGAGPVVIEKVRTKLDGDVTTRSMTIVRQGDEVVAIFKGEGNSRRPVEVRASELLDYRAVDEASR